MSRMGENNTDEEIKVKKEVETMEIEISTGTKVQEYSISSVLDELEGFLDSRNDAKTEYSDEDFVKETSNLEQEDKNSCENKVKYVPKKVIGLSCQNCVFRTNSENILKLHTNYMHGTNFDVDENTDMSKVKKVRQKREIVKRRTVLKSGVPNPCKLCDYQCNSLPTLIEHYGKEHGRPAKTLFLSGNQILI